MSGADLSQGNVEMSAYADKAGHSALKANINYVSGWVTGQVAAEALAVSPARLLDFAAAGRRQPRGGRHRRQNPARQF